MLGFAFAPLVSGAASDRYGRRPVVVFACTLFIIASIGCALKAFTEDANVRRIYLSVRDARRTWARAPRRTRMK
jgi:MFS family permease